MMKWPLVPLQRVVLVNPKDDDHKGLSDDTPVSFVPMSAVSENGFGITERIVKPLGDVRRGYSAFKNNDVLFAKITPCMENGKSAVATGLENARGFGSTEFHVLRAGSTLLPDFLHYFLRQKSFRLLARQHMRGGAGQQRVPSDFLQKEAIPLPPLSEQRRIVEVLDQADRLRRLRMKADAKAERILPALFIRMFGDPATNPMKWPVKPFYMICESRLGKMLDQKKQTGKDLRPYLRNANVYWDRIDLQEVLQMDFNDSDREEFRLRKRDILICEGGEVGRSAIWSDELPECYFQKALHRVRPYPNAATPEYIVFLLWRLAEVGALKDTASKMTFSHLTGVKLKALQIPVPPFSLQKKFSMQVRAIKQVLNLTESDQNRISSLFFGILHRAFSGTLTVPVKSPRKSRIHALGKHRLNN